jgi:WD40 repeat protein
MQPKEITPKGPESDS